MKLDELLDKKQISQAGLAAALGVSQGMVWQWVHGRRRVPAERCPDIEAATDGAVTCEDMRPDVSWHVVRGQCACARKSAQANAADRAAVDGA